jgi:hypothetical protein
MDGELQQLASSIESPLQFNSIQFNSIQSWMNYTKSYKVPQAT